MNVKTIKATVAILLILVIAGIGYFIYNIENNSSLNLNSGNIFPSKLVDQPQKPEEEQINPEHFYCPVLLYHHIAKSKVQNSYYVSPEIFEEQMKWLKENNYHVISYDKFYQAASGEGTLPSKPVVITFDDSLLDQYTNAYPILRKYNYPATFFVKLNDVSNKGTSALTFSEIKKMAENGMTIGSHSMNHDNMADMDTNTLYYELNQSKKVLEQNTGVKIKYFSYPGGAYSSSTVIATKNAGYLSAVTTKHKVFQEIKTPNSIFQIPRVHIDDEMPTFIDWVQGINLH